jgi:cytochrome c-type biogenesis protein CcmH/NrfG
VSFPSSDSNLDVQKGACVLGGAYKFQPNDPQSSLFLGQVYAQLGRAEEARRILTEGEQLATRAGQTTTAAHFREMLQGL